MKYLYQNRCNSIEYQYKIISLYKIFRKTYTNAGALIDYIDYKVLRYERTSLVSFEWCLFGIKPYPLRRYRMSILF